MAVVRRQLGLRAVGHAGTLDPFATGLLVVMVGKATRLARFVEGLTKVYEAEVVFGAATATDDATGAVVREMVPTTWPDLGVLAAAAEGLQGTRMQRPPAFSAKHIGGTRSYRLARRGEPVELPEVPVRIDALDLVEWRAPRLRIRATVGRGTYLRAVARDLGDAIGVPAHCAELRRTAIGPFSVDDAVLPTAVMPAMVREAAALLPGLPQEQVGPDAVVAVRHGRRVAQQARHDGPGALVDGDGRLVAVGNGEDGWWQPTVVLDGAS